MQDDFNELGKQLKAAIHAKTSNWKETVFNTQSYQQELQYLADITKDFIDGLRVISLYSTRGGHVYQEFLCIRATDDVLQSSLAMEMLVRDGIHNTVKRELRYLIEMITKYVVVDYAKMGETLEAKMQYLHDHIPRSSIEIVFNYSTPFPEPAASEFRTEVNDFFKKACVYVHPSKKQLEEQLVNYLNGQTIGFESTAMLRKMNRLVFRGYDMILTMCFHAFGFSMSKDLLEEHFDSAPKWKFHKGKYVRAFRKLL